MLRRLDFTLWTLKNLWDINKKQTGQARVFGLGEVWIETADLNRITCRILRGFIQILVFQLTFKHKIIEVQNIFFFVLKLWCVFTLIAIISRV